MNIDSDIVSFIITVSVIGVAVIIIEYGKRPDNPVRRPTENKVLMLCSAVLAVASLACIPYGFTIPLLCVTTQALLMVLLELLYRSGLRTNLWHPSCSGESRDATLRMFYAITMVVELISLAISFARFLHPLCLFRTSHDGSILAAVDPAYNFRVIGGRRPGQHIESDTADRRSLLGTFSYKNFNPFCSTIVWHQYRKL